MTRLIGVFVVTATVAMVAGIDGRQQSKPAAKPAASTEWPTYGHDPGGMRFSPLTQITPANVSQLQVAWVYHMRPAGDRPPRRRAAPARPRRRTRGAGRGRGRGRGRGGSGFAVSGDHAARHQRRDVHQPRPTAASSRSIRRPARSCGCSSCPTARRRRAASSTGAGDAKTPPQIVFGTQRRPAVLAGREDRRAERSVRRQGHRQPEHARDPAGPARQQRPELAADHVPAPDHHRRPHAGEPAAGSGRRRARLGHPHRQAGLDVPLGSARGRKVQRHMGGRQLEEPLGRQRLGLHHRRRPARHRLHAVRRAVGRSVRRRSRRATTCSARASSRPTPTPESTCGTSRSCTTTSGMRTSRPRRR